MIDTIKVKLRGLVWLDELSSRWEVQENLRDLRKYKKEFDGLVDTVETGRMVQCRNTGLRIWGTVDTPEWVEVSLPRLWHSYNGVLLRDDAEIESAMLELKASVFEVCLPMVGSRESAELTGNPYIRGEFQRGRSELFERFNRIDLVWQFEGSINEWCQAFRASGHPRIRRATVEHRGSGLVFPGSALQIRIYDKHREVYGRPGRIVRVECQLRSAMLDEFGLRDFDLVPGGSFQRLWSIYKELVCALTDREVHNIKTLADFIAVLEAENVVVGGQRAFELWASGKSRASVSRMKNQIKAALPRKIDLDLWSKLRDVVPVDMVECGRGKRCVVCE